MVVHGSREKNKNPLLLIPLQCCERRCSLPALPALQLSLLRVHFCPDSLQFQLRHPFVPHLWDRDLDPRELHTVLVWLWSLMR